MKLKVFQGCAFVKGKQVSACIATTSQAKVAKAISASVGYVRDYWTVTRNAKQIATAMSRPDVLFVASSAQSDDYRPLENER